ncbi:MAG: hypothetical protein ACXWPS_06780 [Ktedonobacteraceae bacterium]
MMLTPWIENYVRLAFRIEKASLVLLFLQDALAEVRRRSLEVMKSTGRGRSERPDGNWPTGQSSL